MLGGKAVSLVVLNPSASRDSTTSAGNAGDRLLELDRFEIPLGARPRGRFLRFSGEGPNAELGREVAFLLRSSARSAKFCSSGGCEMALSDAVTSFSGDLKWQNGFEGDDNRDTVLDRYSSLGGSLSQSCFDVSFDFRGDRFGDTSCKGW